LEVRSELPDAPFNFISDNTPLFVILIYIWIVIVTCIIYILITTSGDSITLTLITVLNYLRNHVSKKVSIRTCETKINRVSDTKLRFTKQLLFSTMMAQISEETYTFALSCQKLSIFNSWPQRGRRKSAFSSLSFLYCFSGNEGLTGATHAGQARRSFHSFFITLRNCPCNPGQ